MEIKAEIVCVGRVSLTYLSIDWHQVQGKQEEEEDESAATLFFEVGVARFESRSILELKNLGSDSSLFAANGNGLA